MTYCTIDDIKFNISDDELAQLTDDSAGNTINTDVIDYAVSDAQSLIDGYLSGRYTLPLNTIPPLIKSIAVDLTIYKLYSRRLQTDMPDSVSDKYKNSINLLTQIQKGVLLLGVTTQQNDTPYQGGGYATNKSRYDRDFNADVMEGF